MMKMAENCAVWVEKMFPLLGFSEIFFQTAEKFQPKF